MTSAERNRPSPLLMVGFLVYLPMLLLLTAIAVFGLATEVPLWLFVTDTNSLAGVSFYAGTLSNFGVLIWCATASICLLTAAVLPTSPTVRRMRYFLLGAGLLTALLMLDDLYMIHELVLPMILGVPENVTLAAYGVAALGLFWYYRRLIYRNATTLLLASGAFFAGSIAVDVLSELHLLPSGAVWDVLFPYAEEAFKLLGIAGWFGYFAWLCWGTLAQSLATTAPAPHDAVVGEGPLRVERPAPSGRD
jgi:hypothetical protein